MTIWQKIQLAMKLNNAYNALVKWWKRGGEKEMDTNLLTGKKFLVNAGAAIIIAIVATLRANGVNIPKEVDAAILWGAGIWTGGHVATDVTHMIVAGGNDKVNGGTQ